MVIRKILMKTSFLLRCFLVVGLKRDKIWQTDIAFSCLLSLMFKLFLLQEPILSSGYICQFNDLEVRAVLLDEIMKVSKLKSYNSDPDTWMVPSRTNVQDCRRVSSTMYHNWKVHFACVDWLVRKWLASSEEPWRDKVPHKCFNFRPFSVYWQKFVFFF